MLKQQAINEGKPEAIAEKMVMGRIKKFYEENCLLKQAFIKDDKQTVADLLAAASKAAGSEVAINRFAFYVMGEGLEKKSEDLQEEVAKASRRDEEIIDNLPEPSEFFGRLFCRKTETTLL